MPGNEPFQVAQLVEGPLTFESPAAAPDKPQYGPVEGPLTFEEPQKPVPTTDEQRGQRMEALKETATDAAKGFGATALRAVPAIAIGGVGSLESFAGDAYKFGRDLFYSGQEKLDLISPEEAERKRNIPIGGELPAGVQLPKEITALRDKGYLSPYNLLPTYKGVVAAEKGVAKKYEIPGLGFEARTPTGKVMEKAAEGAMFGVPGGLRTAAGRIIAGGMSGAAGETAAQVSPDKPYWALASALGGGFAGSTLANAILPTVRGRDQLANALRKDFETKQTRMTPEELREHIAEGRPVTLVDMAGPSTLAYIQKSAGTSNMNASRVAEFNHQLGERASGSQQRLTQNIDEVFGRPIDADQYAQEIQRANKTTRDQVWGLARANPAAAAIPRHLVAGLEKNPEFKKAMEDAAKYSQGIHDKYNIVVPSTTPGTAAIPAKPQGFGMSPATPATPGTYTPGNLSYWHQVDRQLGDMKEVAGRNGERLKAESLGTLQKDLREKINSVVPEYGNAIQISSKTFTGDNAPKAGENFANTLLGKRKNPFIRGDVIRDFNAMPPENREALAIGAIHAIRQRINDGDLTTIYKKMLMDKNFEHDMRVVLGPERYHQVRGSVIAEGVLSKIPKIAESAPGSHAGAAGVAGAYGAGAAYMAENFGNLMSMPTVTPELATKMLTAAALGAVAKGTHLKFQQRVANKVLPLIFSSDPKNLATLSRYAEESGLVRQMFNRMTTTLATATAHHRERLAREEAAKESKKRASGGRTNSDIETKAQALITKAEKAHSGNAKQTQGFLRHSDESIAKALAVANEAI